MKLPNKVNTLALAATAYIVTAAPALAQTINLCPQTGQLSGICTDNRNFASVLSKIITLILVGAVILALFFLIWGGIKWIMSGGDKAKVESARNTIIAAIIGLIIAFLAFFILNVVAGLFGIGAVNQLQLPKILG
jgi:hypothetical protein